MTTSSPVNPYEPPREPSLPPSFSDRDAIELADLHRRISELERQVGQSWMVRGNLLLKTLAVWGYLILGYMVLLAVVFSAMLVIRLVRGGWP